MPTGGIGATVNIITAKPFDNPGFQSVVSGKMVHETSSGDASVANLDEFTPELAAMFSNTFADDTIGVLVSASYQERDNREENAAVAQWMPNVQLDRELCRSNEQQPARRRCLLASAEHRLRLVRYFARSNQQPARAAVRTDRPNYGDA